MGDLYHEGGLLNFWSGAKAACFMVPDRASERERDGGGGGSPLAYLRLPWSGLRAYPPRVNTLAENATRACHQVPNPAITFFLFERIQVCYNL